MKYFNFISFILVLLFLSGCNDTDFVNDNDDSYNNFNLISNSINQSDSDNDYQSVFNAREQLTKAISCIPNENKIRVFQLFENLCLSTNSDDGQEHYEQEFFFNLEKDTPRDILDGSSLAEMISNGNSEVEQTIQFLCMNDPGLTIMLINLNGSQIFDDRVFFDNDFDDSDENSSIVYYDNCERNTVLISETPVNKAFIIRVCETYLSPSFMETETFQKTMNLTKTIGTICGNDIVLWDNVFKHSGDPDPDPDTSNPGLSEECDCERDCINKKENIHKFSACKDYDGGWKGDGEFVFYSIFAEDVQYSTDANGDIEIDGDALNFVRHVYLDVEGDCEWLTPDFEIIRWNLEAGDGDRMKHILYELDWGPDFKIKPKLTAKFILEATLVTATLGTEIIINDYDDLIGESIVDYCDDIDPDGFEYHPSSEVRFTMNER